MEFSYELGSHGIEQRCSMGSLNDFAIGAEFIAI